MGREAADIQRSSIRNATAISLPGALRLAATMVTVRRSSVHSEHLEQDWTAWVEEEMKRRAIAGLYVVDGFLMSLCANRPSIRHRRNMAPIPADERVYLCESSSTWSVARHNLDPETESMLFTEIFDRLMNGAPVPRISACAKTVVLEGLFAILSDHLEQLETIGGVNDHGALTFTLYRFYVEYINPPEISEPALCARWHAICMHVALSYTALEM